jgi:hypothetical protein
VNTAASKGRSNFDLRLREDSVTGDDDSIGVYQTDCVSHLHSRSVSKRLFVSMYSEFSDVPTPTSPKQFRQASR